MKNINLDHYIQGIVNNNLSRDMNYDVMTQKDYKLVERVYFVIKKKYGINFTM